MAYYYPGYTEARQKLAGGTRDEWLQAIDALQGRDNLEYGASDEDVRDEALRQLQEEFTDKSSREYERVNFYVGLHKAMQKGAA